MSLEAELSQLLNRHSAENRSDTPDFILAQYLLECLHAFDRATIERTAWYRDPDSAPERQTVPDRQETDEQTRP